METLWQVEANIDDMNPQWTGYLFERLLAAGVNDVWAVPVIMKKGRPALTLCILCSQALLDEVSRFILRETTSIGVRYFPVERRVCERREVQVAVDGRTVRCKISLYEGAVTTISAEYDDCRAAAAATGIPLKEWQRKAKEEAYKQYG